MSRTRRQWLLGATMTAALVLALGVGWNMALAGEGEARVSGGGEATAEEFVEYVEHPHIGGTRQVPSIGTVGNRFTFGFHAKKDSDGSVKGQMQLRDHATGMVIHSDVVTLSVPHSSDSHPVGAPGGLTCTMRSSTESVRINGKPAPD